MDFIASTIISGILYDLIKKGVSLTYLEVFGNIDNNDLDRKLCNDLLMQINEVQTPKEKNICVHKLLGEENEYTQMLEDKMYKTNFAKRLDYLLLLINKSKNSYGNKLGIEELGEYLGFNSVNELKRYYIDKIEPEYKFIDDIAEKIGVNPKWLKYGQETPFKNNRFNVCDPGDILRECNIDLLKRFYFVMGDGEVRRDITVICQYDNTKYLCCDRSFVFHAQVGGSGSAELCRVYHFLREINSRGLMPSGVYKVTEDDFYRLIHGEYYPGIINSWQQGENNYLLDDFISLYKNEEQKENYKRMYGDVFVNCQSRIRYVLTNK